MHAAKFEIKDPEMDKSNIDMLQRKWNLKSKENCQLSSSRTKFVWYRWHTRANIVRASRVWTTESEGCCQN